MFDAALTWVRPRRALGVPFLLREAAGALGDLGTFVPIAVGMVQLAGLDAGTILVFAGLANLVTGLAFRVPMAVQPMKAIGALAIAGVLTAEQVSLAGLTVGACMLAIGAGGLAARLDRWLPRTVLQGVQLAVAASLAASGLRLGLFAGASAFRPLGGGGGMLTAAAALAVVLLLRRRLGAAALVLLALGLFGAAMADPALAQIPEPTLWRPRWALVGAGALPGLWRGGLPQLPLTLLNSVFLVSALAAQLFPEQRARTTPARVAVSVGLMNLVACPFGSMPFCHGSGGLAGQHQFGARTHVSLLLLGAAKLALGLFFAAAALAWMRAFPTAILSVFLMVAGAALARASRAWDTRRGLAIGLVVTATHLASGQLLLGFAAGWLAHLALPTERPAAPPRTGGPDA